MQRASSLRHRPSRSALRLFSRPRLLPHHEKFPFRLLRARRMLTHKETNKIHPGGLRTISFVTYVLRRQFFAPFFLFSTSPARHVPFASRVQAFSRSPGTTCSPAPAHRVLPDFPIAPAGPWEASRSVYPEMRTDLKIPRPATHGSVRPFSPGKLAGRSAFLDLLPKLTLHLCYTSP
jgi:hypothetical protein